MTLLNTPSVAGKRLAQFGIRGVISTSISSSERVVCAHEGSGRVFKIVIEQLNSGGLESFSDERVRSSV